MKFESSHDTTEPLHMHAFYDGGAGNQFTLAIARVLRVYPRLDRAFIELRGSLRSVRTELRVEFLLTDWDAVRWRVLNDINCITCRPVSSSCDGPALLACVSLCV